MEEVGVPISHSLLPMAKKRGFPWGNPNSQQQQQLQDHDNNWSPNIWDWDSVNFVAKPSTTNFIAINEDVENITTLNLGGNSYSAADEPLSRPNKSPRSLSTSGRGSGSCSYPMCQVDNCSKDLSNAKDYHRRHKVCDVHSKTANAFVRNQMQRFCQQCSRFHPLPDFDEGKRSCRRRLAGHNSRRRKSQPESTPNGKLDVINLLTLLAQLQERITNEASIPDKEQTIQMLTVNSASRFPSTRGFDLNVSEQIPLDHPKKVNQSLEENSPLSRPPVVQKMFPLHSESRRSKHGSSSVGGEDKNLLVKSTAHGWSSSSQFLRSLSQRAEDKSVQLLTCQTGYNSSTGSDLSPFSSNSDVQDHTGRIIFKLFDKDPSNLPANLKMQIYNWLSNSPSEMESYIRPGCVALSIYIAMPRTTWAKLQEELLWYVKSLVQDSVADFWRSGRFLVHMDRQLASHKNGKIHVRKPWRTLIAPELLSVSPLAVVCGQETSFVLRGRYLTIPGTKIHCTYKGKYISKNVKLPEDAAYEDASTQTAYEDASTQTFDFPSGSPSVQGRCFIEVENGFKGNNFPVIISDSSICEELRLLESELDDIVLTDQVRNYRQPRPREDALQFLNELGWLFQKNTLSKSSGLYFSLTRFRFLLVFSVERDWSALVKTLLDIFVESNGGMDGLSRESLETLDGIHLLNRAVKRKCLNMVNLLIQYELTCETTSSKKYLFSPNKASHGGITPLHLAASMQDSEHIVDALTSKEIGLTCWTSQLDDNGQSPYTYASLRDNHNYNILVTRKLADLKFGQVSISVGDNISLDSSHIPVEQADRTESQSLQGRRPCVRCSVVMTRHYKAMPGAQGLLHRPYVLSMLTIASICVCVCLFLRGSPYIGRVEPFKWENVLFGTI